MPWGGHHGTYQSPGPQALHHHADVGHALGCGFLERSDRWLGPSGSCWVHVSSSCPGAAGSELQGEGTPKCKQAEDSKDTGQMLGAVRADSREHSAGVRLRASRGRLSARTALPPSGLSHHRSDVAQEGGRRASDRQEPGACRPSAHTRSASVLLHLTPLAKAALSSLTAPAS